MKRTTQWRIPNHIVHLLLKNLRILFQIFDSYFQNVVIKLLLRSTALFDMHFANFTAGFAAELDQSRYIDAANSLTNSADATFEYSFSDSPLPLESFIVCIRIWNNATEQLALKLSCIPSSQRTITLRNMKRGDYTIFMQLKLSAPSESPSEADLDTLVMTKSEISIPLSVADISNLLPQLQLPDSLKEYAANTITGTADVTFSYSLLGVPSAVSQVQACLQIADLNNGNKIILKSTCVPREHTQFTLSRMKVGHYKALLTLRNELNPSKYVKFIPVTKIEKIIKQYIVFIDFISLLHLFVANRFSN